MSYETIAVNEKESSWLLGKRVVLAGLTVEENVNIPHHLNGKKGLVLDIVVDDDNANDHDDEGSRSSSSNDKNKNDGSNKNHYVVKVDHVGGEEGFVFARTENMSVIGSNDEPAWRAEDNGCKGDRYRVHPIIKKKYKNSITTDGSKVCLDNNVNVKGKVEKFVEVRTTASFLATPLQTKDLVRFAVFNMEELTIEIRMPSPLPNAHIIEIDGLHDGSEICIAFAINDDAKNSIHKFWYVIWKDGVIDGKAASECYCHEFTLPFPDRTFNIDGIEVIGQFLSQGVVERNKKNTKLRGWQGMHVSVALDQPGAALVMLEDSTRKTTNTNNNDDSSGKGSSNKSTSSPASQSTTIIDYYAPINLKRREGK
mmetsp:Transcript_15664/g.17936  ORF Transcript_15664/g.17936 Transcript_15664/m.17936 type:complete len:368 (+) Transcript_15664:176-1279(+)|eukprot:CAMPEP_0170958790 /NCGR_PEP_ID=MMETSP0735-20130129/35913_1 /TAXON_ID=186038 /ORGANISM="Fragilariopsis kerguelensis, Strain L26-C5" /LENGTH=367 /DNA_ID=CAMNT_0011372777 /DNA_START=102 /DNA_END=1205 /DNA_ORIENTATION=-